MTEEELRRRASKVFTNPEDALIAFRELLELKGIKKEEIDQAENMLKTTKGGHY